MVMAKRIDVESLRELVSQERKLIVVTGAGVSTGSGIPDFASVDDEWDAPVPRSVAISKGFWEVEPELFWSYYKKLFAVKSLNSFAPSAAHNFLKELEEIASVQIFTQNVDGLHSLAGSSHVVEVHGNARWLKCVGCSSEFEAHLFFNSDNPLCPDCGNRLKPTVVLFGEPSEGYELLQNAYRGPGVALFMGTSLQVAPVSNYPYFLAAHQPQFYRVYWNNVVSEENERYFHQVIEDDFSSL